MTSNNLTAALLPRKKKKPRKIPKKWPQNPDRYDLVTVTVERANHLGVTIETKLSGWWDGREWVGRRLKATDTIIFWEKAKLHADEK